MNFKSFLLYFFLNNYCSIGIWFRDEHPIKAFSPIRDMDDEVTICLKDLQFLNDFSPMDVTDGIIMPVNDEHPLKVDSPMSVTEERSDIWVRDEILRIGENACDSQPQKVELSIFVIEEGMDFCVRNLKRLYWWILYFN